MLGAVPAIRSATHRAHVAASLPSPLPLPTHPHHYYHPTTITPPHPYRLRQQLEMEEERRRRWADENVRRRTDYIPFAFQLLSALAERGELQPLVQAARQAHTAKWEQRQQKQ